MKTVVQSDVGDTITVDQACLDNIYVLKSDSIYKAHRVSEGRYAFIDLSDSRCWANGAFITLGELLAYAIAYGWDVYEFDNLKEFATWLSDNT